jgi:2-haloacid dehalogenase
VANTWPDDLIHVQPSNGAKMIARRTVIQGGVSLAATAAGMGTGFAQNRKGSALAASGKSLGTVKALFFDVFGTLVDWRTGVAREAEALLKPRGISLDWLGFADAWRAEYLPTTQGVRSGRVPYVKLDALERQMLDRILPGFGLKDLPEDTRRQLNLAWHRLDGWPDVRAGLVRLGHRFRLAPVSNGNISLMADIAARNGWRWDAILGADIAHDYKPKADVYLAAVQAFDLDPADCMMVAAHDIDLTHGGASAAGLRTAYIARPGEYGPGKKADPLTGKVDVSASSLADLADKLGV